MDGGPFIAGTEGESFPVGAPDDQEVVGGAGCCFAEPLVLGPLALAELDHPGCDDHSPTGVCVEQGREGGSCSGGIAVVGVVDHRDACGAHGHLPAVVRARERRERVHARNLDD